MCGIFGAIGDATDEALEAAVSALRDRGPDSSGAWRSDGIGLAHTRLKVIDLSDAAAQPMAGCDPEIRITFNGEIYNHRQLRAELEAKGHQFKSRSDTESILHGYEEWGDAVVRHLDGMFALGIWDGKRRRLLLARDRTGKKPLFYSVARGALRFASEPKALLAAGHPATVDPAALPMFLSWGYVPPPATLYAGIQQLPPASRLVYQPGRPPSVDEYWRPTFRDPPLEIGFDEAKATVRKLVVDAVERRLEADVPLGAFLSGGIDSTIVVGVMARLLGRKVRTYSIGFPRFAAYDEAPAAEETAKRFGTEHTTFQLEPCSPELVERLVHLHDGPFADSSAIPTYAVSRLTRERVTVALSGDGGDELFAGYLRFLAAEAMDRIPSLLRTPFRPVYRLIPAGLPHHSLGARARRFVAAVGDSMSDRIARWNSSFAFELDALLRPEVASRLDLHGPLDWQRTFFEGGGSPLARVLDHNFRTYLPNDLHVKVDRCSAGVGLEVRCPLLDTALVEYAGRLPDRFRRRGTRTKHILREAFADLIPEHIKRRPKRGFAVPLADWFRGELRDYVRDLLLSRPRSAELLRPGEVERLVTEHDARRDDHSARLWTLLTFEVWLRSVATVGRAVPVAEARA